MATAKLSSGPVSRLGVVHTYTEASAATARALAELCLDRLAMQAPLDYSLSPEELTSRRAYRHRRRASAPSEALRLWEHVLAPACLSVDHPRYLSFIPGRADQGCGGLRHAGRRVQRVRRLLAGGRRRGLRREPGAALDRRPGRPAGGAGGVFVQGGTIGNLSALVAARENARHKRGGEAPARWAVVVTDETHSSVKHALKW